MNYFIDFPDKTNVLEPLEDPNSKLESNSHDSSLLSLSTCVLENQHFILFCCVYQEDVDMVSNFLNSAIRIQKLFRELSGNIFQCVSLLYTGNSSNESEVYRGVCVYPSKGNDTLNEAGLLDAAEGHGFQTYFTVTTAQNKSLRRIVERNITSKDILSDKFYKIVSSKRSFHSTTECHSRLYSSAELCPVYHGYKETRSLLNKCIHMPEVVKLLDIADKNIPENFDVAQLQNLISHPFVVVEGLDATGKTTLTETLERKLNATRYYTPPPEISDLRKFFDALPEIIRRAYYCIGNYIVAIQIAKECQSKPVIMDRYWHSTTAYGIANESSTSDMPPKGHWVYEWPKDLLKPTLVLFLSVSEEVRKQRIKGRGGEKTFEEKHLDRDVLFRGRLCEAYRRMESPGCIEIDASGSKDSVVQAAIEELAKHDIHLL